jgi:ABC-type nitrate/sulfonate/bicarbonate transport system substrate-binding protein
MLAPPFNITANESGFRELVSFLKDDFVELQGSIVVREELLKSNPTLVEKFSRATLKGLIYARENRSGAVPILVKYLKVDKAAAGKYYDSVREVMTRDGTVNDEHLQKFYQLSVDRFKSKDPSPINRMFDYSLAKKLNSQLQASGWRPTP